MPSLSIIVFTKRTALKALVDDFRSCNRILMVSMGMVNISAIIELRPPHAARTRCVSCAREDDDISLNQTWCYSVSTPGENINIYWIALYKLLVPVIVYHCEANAPCTETTKNLSFPVFSSDLELQTLMLKAVKLHNCDKSTFRLMSPVKIHRMCRELGRSSSICQVGAFEIDRRLLLMEPKKYEIHFHSDCDQIILIQIASSLRNLDYRYRIYISFYLPI